MASSPSLLETPPPPQPQPRLQLQPPPSSQPRLQLQLQTQSQSLLQPQAQVRSPPRSKSESQYSQQIAFLERMPKDLDITPFAYVKQLQVACLRNSAEELIMRSLMKRNISIAKLVSKQPTCQENIRPNSQQVVIPLPNRKRKFVSKSAPATPSEPSILRAFLDQGQSSLGNGNAAANAIARVAEDMARSQADNDSSKQQNITGLEEVTSTAGLVELELQDPLCPTFRVDKALINLYATVDFATDFMQNRVGKGYEPYLCSRQICKLLVELKELMVKIEGGLTEEQMKSMVRGAIKLSELFETFVNNVEFGSGMDFKETGVDFLLDQLINLLAVNFSGDVMVSMIRTNFVHDMFQGLSVLGMRRLMLGKLWSAVKCSLTVCYKALISTRKAALLDFSTMTSLFAYLQLLEFVLMTSSQQPWLEVEEMKLMRSIEKKCLEVIPFANIQLYISRVVTIARKFEKISTNPVNKA